MTDWATIFDRVERWPTDSEAVDAALSGVHRPLSADEVAEVNAGQRNPFPPTDPLHSTYRPFDPRGWPMPRTPLPPAYVRFLKWSDGGDFQTGDRAFQMLAAGELRETLLAYHVPQYMPMAQPFAFNGGGCFYLFDLREPAVDGEVPIAFVGCGDLGFEDAVVLGTSFEAVLRDGRDPEGLLV